MRHFSSSFAELPILVSIYFALTISAVDPACAESIEVGPKQVGKEIKEVVQIIDRIYLELGRNKPKRLGVQVTHAGVHDVFFLADEILDRASILNYEYARVHLEPPKKSTVVSPGGAEVLLLVQLTRERLGDVLANLGAVVNDQQITDGELSWNDCYETLLAVSRDLNGLVYRPITPSLVFRQVTHAVNYMAVLLSDVEAANWLESDPPFEARKRPSDVYQLLLDCLTLLLKASSELGVTKLEFSIEQQDLQNIEPSDCLHLAKLLVAQLDHLAGLANRRELVRPAYYVRAKSPAHVFQRAKVLQGQLKHFSDSVERSGSQWTALLRAAEQ